MPIDGDFLRVEQSLNAGYLEAAIKLYTAYFLAKLKALFYALGALFRSSLKPSHLSFRSG
jgi:hypothetical protein